MLSPTDLQTLTDWCHGRAMRWSALRADPDAVLLLLEPAVATRPWLRMRLLASEHFFLLEDAAGEALARASDLPALLDVLDGGVADAPPLMMFPARHDAAEAVPAFA